jgi:1,4-dihydroxy-2-naphthoate octaprenyltransferase
MMTASTYWKGFGRLADPRLTLASISSMLIGTAAAARLGSLHVGWLAVTVVGIVALEIAKNASGEITDFDSGTDASVSADDRSPFSGGRRVIVDGLLTRAETRGIAALTYAVGIALGLWIAWGCEPRVAWIGVAGTALAWLYAGAPCHFAYRGWGELAVALAYGPLICSGAYLVQSHVLPWRVVLLSLPVGLLIAGFLWINEFPDYRADLAAGKRNLVVRLGRPRASRAFALILLAGFLLQLALPLFGLSRGVWLGLAGAPWAWAAARRALASPDTTARIIDAQRWTLLSFVLLAVGTAAGLLLTR